LRAARQVIVTSAATVEDVRALAGDSVALTVVEPGTDAAGTPRLPTASPSVQLLSVASLTPRKGHAWLLQALAGLQHLRWLLHIVGSANHDPATAAALRQRCEVLGLAARVSWHGEADDDALAAHYAAADVFVMPSWHEGYGMALAEALMHGLPVVASSGVALARTLPPDAARVLPVGDVAALRDALAALIESPAQRAACADAARAAALRLPSWQQSAQRFGAALEQVR
jgi:glycosyltransferase involved in cell wall biosynthesis